MSGRDDPGSHAPALLDRGGRRWVWLPIAVCAYVLGVLWADREIDLAGTVRRHAGILLMCLAPVALSFLLRYQRWRLLLQLQGRQLPWRAGLLAYLSGFALTVSPGKAGELLRIRYHQPFDIPAPVVIRAFLCERSLDLVVLLGLASLVATRFPAFAWLAAIVGIIVAGLAALAAADRLRDGAADWLSRFRGRPLADMARVLVEASSALRLLASLRATAMGAGLGLLAWLSTCASFLALCRALDVVLPVEFAWGVYPLAMLLGAASGVPGGVGTTEAAIVLLLTGAGQPYAAALTVAILSRVVTLWFAVLVGLVSMGLAERTTRSETV